MDQSIVGLIQFGIILVPIALGLVTGTLLEKRHYASIRAREALYLEQPVISFLKSTGETDKIEDAYMVSGSAVISIDYFKRFLAGLINIFGGRVTPYESLVDRARREALLRMQDQAPEADIIVNVRIETSTIGGNTGGKNKGVCSVEALAYGTALKYK